MYGAPERERFVTISSFGGGGGLIEKRSQNLCVSLGQQTSNYIRVALCWRLLHALNCCKHQRHFPALQCHASNSCCREVSEQESFRTKANWRTGSLKTLSQLSAQLKHLVAAIAPPRSTARPGVEPKRKGETMRRERSEHEVSGVQAAHFAARSQPAAD